MKFFSKISSKKPNSSEEDDEDTGHYESKSQPSSPTKPPSKSSGSRSPTKKAAAQRPVSPTSRDSKQQQSPRISRPFARHPTDPGLSSSRRKKIDPDTHPLNLPPEQRKRFSELSAMSDRNSMDVDKEPVNGGNPSSSSSSPPPQPPQQPPQYQQQKTPIVPSHTNSFTVPVTNGTDASTNGTADEAVPPPPPHRSQPSSPVQSEAEQAESFKNDGNKFFKAGDYTHAIEFYTKGELTQARLCVLYC
jgi:DnaJ family protein C protein 7